MKFFSDLWQGCKNVFKGPASKDNLFSLDNRVPFKSAIPFGLQHFLAMFASNITPILIVFSRIGLTGDFAVYSMLSALFMAGFATMIQLFFGARLPVVMGTSFTFLPIFITIGISAGGGEAAYYTILGSTVVGGLIATVLSLTHKWWGRIIKPIVPPVVVLGVGLSLLANGANGFFGGNSVLMNMIENGNTGTGVPYFCYIIVALATLITALLWSLFIKGVWKNINIVVGIAVGYIISCCIPGMIDFSKLAVTEVVGSNGVIDYPHLINIGKLRIELVPCILVTICFLVTIVEEIGGATAVAETGLQRKPTVRELGGTLVVGNVTSSIGALFGAFPLTTYAQNVGVVAQNKVVNRFTIFIGAIFLFIASFFPPVANFIYTIPDAVIGGTMVILFGSIAVIGMKSISELGWNDKNIMITAISVCLGFGITVATVTTGSGLFMSTSVFNKVGLEWLGDLLSNCVLNMFVISFILSWLLPDSMHISLFHKKENKQ